MSNRLLISGGFRNVERVIAGSALGPANEHGVIKIPQRLPPMPTPKDLLRIYRIKARKHLNQNFLLFKRQNDKIVAAAGVRNNDYVLELGPGPGAITRQILERGPKQLVVLERDRRFLPMLEMLSDAAIPGQMHIVLGDVLQHDFGGLFPKEIASPWEESPPPVRVVSNLPFHIATPLIIKWVKLVSKRQGIFELGRVPLTMTFQKEVAERICAPVLDFRRSRLSVMIQNYCDVKLKFDISSKYFIPKPEVDVGVVKFTPRITPLCSGDLPFEVFEKFVRHLFHFRRKYIKHCTATLFPKESQKAMNDFLYETTGIDPQLGCTWLSVQEIGELAAAYVRLCNENPGLLEYDYRKPEKSPRSAFFKERKLMSEPYN